MFELLTLMLVKILAWLGWALGIALCLKDLVFTWFSGTWIGLWGIPAGIGGWPLLTGIILLGFGFLAGTVLVPLAGPLVLLGTLITRASSPRI